MPGDRNDARNGGAAPSRPVPAAGAADRDTLAGGDRARAGFGRRLVLSRIRAMIRDRYR